MLDLAPLDGSDPVTNHETVERELTLHDPRLAALPRILALSKADLLDGATAAAVQRRWRDRLHGAVPVLLTSAATRQGLDELIRTLLRTVGPAASDGGEGAVQGALAAVPADAAPLAEHRTFKPRATRDYTVTRTEDGVFTVDGQAIRRLVARYDLDNEDALAHLERRLRGIGVIRALEAAGFEPGDDVELAGIAFELDPSGR